MQFKTIQIVCALVLASLCSSFAVSYEISRVASPKPLREFRGLWIATVANIDWPSKPGLSTAAQKAELISILDRTAQLKLNAVIFQVRPACDAFYDSKFEPWSEYLTGTMGKAPEPYYDPLTFAIEEAHKRGLELHAWFNPYRALHKSHEGGVSADHISRTRPDLVRRFGQYLWLDPGERDVQEHSLKVVMDVVKRYDVDAVHFDDYFYPDPNEAPGAFPDEASWKKFGAGGKLSREDWRRENVNRFIERTYDSIKATKPWVKFGVSPHGIWRPSNPPQIRTGSDTYAKLFADTRKWLANGWVDYFSPQLYWRIESEYSFPILLDWWSQQNVKKRHLWPGLSAAYALSYKWPAEEIPNQIRNTRKETDGYLFYNTSSLLMNTALLETLQHNLQTQPALVPASPWMGDANLPKPGVSVSGNPESLKLSWSMEGTNAVRWWVVQTRVAGDWQTEILPASVKSKPLGVAPEAIGVTAIDRFGNASSSSALEAKKAATRHRILQKKY